MVMGPRVHKLPCHMSPCVASTVYINMSGIVTACVLLQRHESRHLFVDKIWWISAQDWRVSGELSYLFAGWQ